jgi:hypothetical protein
MHATRILAAIGPNVRDMVSRAIGRDTDVLFVDSLDEAIRRLEHEHFSMIISCARFDQSRMLDLLMHCDHAATLEDTPFLCFRAIPGILPERTYADIHASANALGAKYIDLAHWTDLEGTEKAMRQFRGVIDSMLQSGSHYLQQQQRPPCVAALECG